MFHRIVVPLDGEPFAEAALVPASELARVFGSQLLLVRAGPGSGPSSKGPVAPSDDALELLGEADAYLHDVVRELRASGCDADMLLYVAEPGAAIADAAQTHGADLIVMAAHTRWAVQPMSLPSTTVAVLAHASVPVLAWRPPSMKRNGPPAFDNGAHIAQPETPIIVPLDGSLRAEGALPLAEALASAFGTYLVLVHALTPSGSKPADRRDTGITLVLEDASDATQYLEVVRGEILARGGHATTVVRAGQPFQVIERCWREFGGSLIVTASRGQTETHGDVLGSVARRLVEELEAPVLVIPPERAVAPSTAAQDVVESSPTIVGGA